jgi:hypothetical protein
VFRDDQVIAVGDVFWLAGYDEELRTLPPDADEIAFILEQDDIMRLKDEYVVERVLTKVLRCKVLVLASIGNETVPFG